MSQFAANQWFEVEHCCSCRMAFAMTTDFQRARLADRKSFFCPQGHPQSYTGPTEAQKLKTELERTRQQAEASNARAAAAEADRSRISKAHTTMRKRIVNGVCPCCNRTFQNLMSHMRTEHPDFAATPAATLATLRRAFGMSQIDVANETGVKPAYVSMYERDKNPPKYARESLDRWVSRHDPAAAQAQPASEGGAP